MTMPKLTKMQHGRSMKAASMLSGCNTNTASSAGRTGDLVCDFVDRLGPPLILTLHTVLTDPTPKQRAILEYLISRASRIMVMSIQSRDLLAELYGAPHEILHLIPHGAPDRPFGRQDQFKQLLGLDGRTVLMTFGLLGPGKGIERVIEALPKIVEQDPGVLYRIVGATHPNLLAREGEAYRERLQQLASKSRGGSSCRMGQSLPRNGRIARPARSLRHLPDALFQPAAIDIGNAQLRSRAGQGSGLDALRPCARIAGWGRGCAYRAGQCRRDRQSGQSAARRCPSG